jgi:hypothetical protein
MWTSRGWNLGYEVKDRIFLNRIVANGRMEHFEVGERITSVYVTIM